MPNIAILEQINSTNFTEIRQVYKPTLDHSGFITSLGLTINVKSIPSANFPYIPDDTPPDVLESIFQNIEAETQFKELRILLKKGAGAWIEKAKIRIFNKEPYYEVDLMPYYTKTNTIDVADDLSLGIQVKAGDSLTVADNIVVFGTAVEEKKNNGNEELADRISALESLLGVFGAPSANLPGSNGLVPAPPAAGAEFLLRGDRSWENPNKFATPAQITAAISALVGSSSLDLDTLVELGAALGNDPNFATTVLTALANRVSKVGAETIADVKTFTSRIQIQSNAPGFWLDELDNSYGIFLVLDGNTLQVQRRPSGFGTINITAVLAINLANFTVNFIQPTTILQIAGIKVLGARVTGWSVPTGTPNKSAAFNADTATLLQVSQRLLALENDLRTHGLIGA